MLVLIRKLTFAFCKLYTVRSHITIHVLRYGEIRGPGVLYLFKDEHAALMLPHINSSNSNNSSILASIDLRDVEAFTVPEKKGKETTNQLDLELSDETVKLKYANITDSVLHIPACFNCCYH